MTNLESIKNRSIDISNKVRNKMDTFNQKRKNFFEKGNWKKGFKRPKNTNFDQSSHPFNNHPAPAMDSPPNLLSSSENLKDQANSLTLKKESEDSINRDENSYLRGMNQPKPQIKRRIFKRLMHLLVISFSVLNEDIPLQINNRIIILRTYEIVFVITIIIFRIIIVYLMYYIFIWVCSITLWLLKSAFRFLSDKILLKKAKLKENESEPEHIEESKGFWDKHLGYLSHVIKIVRGGRLVPIRETNIYEFSELDQQNALLFISSIPASMEFEVYKSEFKELDVESGRRLIPRKRLRLKVKEVYSTVKRLPSKLKNLIRLRISDHSYKVLVIIIGILIFLMAANGGTMILARPRNLSNYESVLPIERVEPSVLPRVQPYIKEVSQNTNLILSEMKDSRKDSLNTISPLKSGERVRKKAKVVGLSDLSPLPDQDFDLEIESTPISRSTPLKIRVD